ncbi:hypothetical protein N7454_001494 [Penicillium verhagenii]|nr:hypothetical protein N7454_001494 [Penicillium verhagenii]
MIDLKRAPRDPRIFSPVPSKAEQNIERFASLGPEEQNLNDSMRGLSLVNLQNLNSGVVDTYRTTILETVGF